MRQWAHIISSRMLIRVRCSARLRVQVWVSLGQVSVKLTKRVARAKNEEYERNKWPYSVALCRHPIVSQIESYAIVPIIVYLLFKTCWDAIGNREHISLHWG